MKAIRILAWTVAGAAWWFGWMVATAVAWKLGAAMGLLGLVLLWAVMFIAYLTQRQRAMLAAWIAAIGCAFGVTHMIDRANWPMVVTLGAVVASTVCIAGAIPAFAVALADRLRPPPPPPVLPVPERSPRSESPD